jgi:hypothetical protein
MKLINEELEKRFAEVGNQEETPLGDQIVVAKFFNPAGAGTWYATSYDPEIKVAFGYVSIFGDWNDEWGDFSIEELESYQSPFKLGIERDLFFKECTAKEIEIISKSL